MKRVKTGWTFFLSQDWLAILLAAGLLVTGLTFIYSASWRGEETGIVGAWFSKQIWWAFIGTGVALALAAVDYRFWIRQAWWIYAATLVLLVLVLVAGRKVYGAYRWLVIFGIPVQPSEFAKISTVLLLARVLGGGAIHPRSFGTVVVTLALMAIPFVLIVVEPDLGTAMVLVPTALFMLFAAGGALRYLIGMGVIGLGGIAFGLSPLARFVLT